MPAAMTGWRVFFLAAGLYNVLGGGWAFFHVEATFRDQGLPIPNYPFAFQLLFAFVVILGVGYLAVARDPLGHRDLVKVGVASKVAGLTLSAWAIVSGQLPASSWWQPVVNDLPWAIGFAVFLVVSADRDQSSVGVGGSAR